MSTTTPVPTTPKVRTYAADLTATRAERGLALPTVPTKKVVVAEKPAAAVIPKKKAAVAVVVQKPVPAPAKKSPATPISKVVTVVPTKPKTVVTTPVAPSVVAEKTNPPFHTLSKSGHVTTPPVTRIDTTEFDAVVKASKPSVLATPGVEQLTVSRTDTTTTGTIITDTKQNHVSFLSALTSTFTGWWHTKQKVAADRKQPKYTVPEAERRKGVIQKATTQTGRTSTADHAAVVSRIKAAKMTPRGTPLPRVSVPLPTPNSAVAVIPEVPVALPEEPFQEQAEQIDTTHLTQAKHIQDEIDALDTILPIAVPALVSQQIISPIIPALPPTPIQEIPVETYTETAAIEQPTPPPVILEEPEVPVAIPPITPFTRARIEPVVPLPAKATPFTTDDTVTDTPTETENRDAENIITNAVDPDILSTKPNWSLVLKQRGTTGIFGRYLVLLSKNWWKETFRVTNNLVVAAALGCGIVVVGWYGLQAVLAHRSITTFAATTPTTIFASAVLITPDKAPRTKQELQDILKNATGNGEPLVELSLTSTKATPSKLPQSAFAILNATVATDFSTSINQVTAGNYRSEPWLVLKTTDDATAKGGMLVWEKTLSADLSPWFGETVQRSTKAGITLFKDGTIAGHDVRILTNDAGTERIIYGLIAPNTLLITTNTTAFLNLAEKVIK